MNSHNETGAVPGTLDQSFADAGIYHLKAERLPGRLWGVKALHGSVPERLYFTGSVGSVHARYVLGYLLPDGTLGRDFGEAGLAIGDFRPNANSSGQSITLLDDGAILVHGWTRNSVPALRRFSSNGAVDTDFGSAGTVVLEYPKTTEPQLTTSNAKQTGEPSTNAFALSDGRILVVVTYSIAHLADTAAFIFRLNSNGSLDTDFNGTGYVQVIHPIGRPEDLKLRSGLIDPDGNIVVCGSLEREAGKPEALLARYKSDGSLDTDFGTQGFVLYSQSPLGFANLDAVIFQPDKRLLAIGSTQEYQGVLISLEADGKANIQFNGGQPLLTRLDDNATWWKAAAMQTDGKIIVIGRTYVQEPSASVIVRLLSDGQLDRAFNGRGWWSTNERGWYFHNLSLQSDGKIVVAGKHNQEGAVLRFNGGNLSNALHD